MSIFSRLVFRLSVPVITLFGLLSFAHAAPQNRLKAEIADTDREMIQKTIPARARLARDMGEAPANRMLSSVTMHFNMTEAQKADLAQLLVAQQNPASPQYHQWLTPAQFGARFGLSSSDMASVESWLSGKGLAVTAVAPSLNYVTVSGTVAQIESAFGTSIHTMSEDGEQHFANITDPTLPSAIAGIVNGITGLNDFKLQSRAAIRPQFTSSISGGHYMAPGDFFTIYDMNPLVSSGNLGNGVTIAVMGQTNISTADVDAFRSAAGLPARNSTNFIITLIPGPNPGTVSGDLDEAMLDVEWANAAAPNSNILYVNSGTNNGVMDSLFYTITNRLAPIITISYGACEVAWGQSNLNVFSQAFQQANAQGQTIVGPSGDSGATDCDFQLTTATQGLGVDFPASSPFVTSAGGTMLNEGTGTYWSGTNGSYSGSALGYIPENVWNESSTSGLAAAGGGVSAYFSKPAWQIGNGVPADLSRDVPDISFNAASTHDGYLYCSSGWCTNGFRNSSSNLKVVGGTSVAAPLFAGVLAVLEQKVGATTGLGNVNPMIYGLANSAYYSSVFHDITSGNNNSLCVLGTQDCPNGGSIGYSAGTGYDRATGWGSLDIANFVSRWTAVTPTGTGSAIGSSLSRTCVTTPNAICNTSPGQITSAICGTTPDKITLVIQVSGTGSVPSGTVQILVDNVPLSDPAASNIALVNGAATYTLPTSITSGGHTVSAVYSGSSTFAGSKGSLDVDVVSSSQKDFSFTPCQASVTAKSGSTASGITLTLTPVNGFTGTINLTAAVDAPVASQFAFSVNPVILTSSSATTTFTLAAFQNSAKVVSSSTMSAKRGAASPMPWYAAGSGATLACALLLTVPRRRRWAALLVVILSAGVFTAAGCGSGSSSSGSSGTSTPTPTTTNAAPGTYNITVTAVSGGIVHSTVVAFTVN